MQAIALTAGFVLVAILGIVHHWGLRTLDRTTGADRTHPDKTIITVFIGLLALHTVEILAYAGAYAALLPIEDIGSLGGDYDGSWSGLVYYSGINFTTLGFTQIETEGPIRLISMMQALGGFMVLTWSATFIYSVWKNAMGRGE